MELEAIEEFRTQFIEVEEVCVGCCYGRGRVLYLVDASSYCGEELRTFEGFYFEVEVTSLGGGGTGKEEVG